MHFIVVEKGLVELGVHLVVEVGVGAGFLDEVRSLPKSGGGDDGASSVLRLVAVFLEAWNASHILIIHATDQRLSHLPLGDEPSLCQKFLVLPR